MPFHLPLKHVILVASHKLPTLPVMKFNSIILEVGGGISYQHTTVELETTSGAINSAARSDIWLPLVNATFGYAFNPRLSVVAELSGLSLSD